MGIDIRAALVVGLPYAEMNETFDGEALSRLIEDDDLEAVAPYYDAPREDCIFGFRVLGSPQCGAREFTGEFTEDQEPVVGKFRTLTGLEPRLYLTADVS